MRECWDYSGTKHPQINVLDELLIKLDITVIFIYTKHYLIQQVSFINLSHIRNLLKPQYFPAVTGVKVTTQICSLSEDTPFFHNSQMSQGV